MRLKTTAPHRPLVVLGVLGCAVLAACTTTSGQATTSDATPVPTPSPTPSPTLAAEAACLEGGTWVLDVAREAALVAEMLRTAAGGVDASFTGETVYVFADGELTRTFTGMREWTTMIPVARPSIIEMTTTLDGSATSPYTATATQVDLGPGDASGVTATFAAVEDGVPAESQDDQPARERAMLEETTTWLFTCTADTLRLTSVYENSEPDPTSELGTMVLHRR